MYLTKPFENLSDGRTLDVGSVKNRALLNLNEKKTLLSIALMLSWWDSYLTGKRAENDQFFVLSWSWTEQKNDSSWKKVSPTSVNFNDDFARDVIDLGKNWVDVKWRKFERLSCCSLGKKKKQIIFRLSLFKTIRSIIFYVRWDDAPLKGNLAARTPSQQYLSVLSNENASFQPFIRLKACGSFLLSNFQTVRFLRLKHRNVHP